MTLPPIPNQQTDFKGWLDWKRPFIGGNDLATIMGVNPYQTMDQLYDRIVHGIMPAKTEDDLDFLDWCAEQEPIIAKRFTKKTGLGLRFEQSMYHPSNPRVIRSSDGVISSGYAGVCEEMGIDPCEGVLEIKGRNPMKWHGIKLKGIPAATFFQLQHYLMIGGEPWGMACEANRDTGKMVIVRVRAEPELHNTLMQNIEEFLAACDRHERPKVAAVPVEKMPDIGGSLITTQQMDDVVLAEFQGHVHAAITAKEIMKQAKEFKEEAYSAAKRFMVKQGYDVAEGFGGRLFAKEKKGALYVDMAALQRAHKDVDIAQFEKRRKGSRPLLVYKVPTDPAGEQRAINAAAID